MPFSNPPAPSRFNGDDILRSSPPHKSSCSPSPQPGAPYTYVTTKTFLSHFGFDTLRDLPDFEALEDAGLLSKDKLLAGDIPVGLVVGEGDGEEEEAKGNIVEDQVS